VAPTGTPARGCTRNLLHDAFGRPGQIRTPDGKRTDLDHIGIRKTVTKQWDLALDLGAASDSASRHEVRDFAGRLVEVHERSAGDTSLVKTSYTYDAGGRLTTVTPGGTGQQARLFFYDGRGFLLSERHPEMAALPSSPLSSVLWDDHDSLGNPGRRTDGDSDVSYDYDFAGRLIRTSDLVLDEPLTEYFYARGNHADGRGGLSRSAGKLHQSRRYNRLFDRPDVVITETFEYSGAEGRLSRTSLRSSQGNGSDVRFTLELGYDALGELSSVTYPGCEGPARCDPATARRQIRRTVERGLLRKVEDVSGSTFPYASSLTYDAAGLTSSVVRGNGVTDTIAVDPSGIPRPREISFDGPFGLWTSGAYSYDGRGNAFRIGADRYRYDAVGRLLEGEVFGGAKRQLLAYDRVGNLTSIGTTERPAYSPAVDPATNRLAEVGIAYSSAGRLIGFRDRSLTYDALERPVAMEGQGVNVRWAYDAGGERVALFDLMNDRETWTLRGPDDRVLRRYRTDDPGASAPAWRLQDYVYQGSRLLATVDEGQIRHLHPDHLGTPRLVTDATGTELSRHTYYPFGEEAFLGAIDDAARRRDETMRFTGHERDVNGESAADPAIDDLDYMHARYYSPFYGRFLTLDPVTGKPADPQSWNRYAYVRGNPLTFLDPTGLDLKNGIVGGYWAEAAFFGFKITVGTVTEADWQNGRGFWRPENDSGVFATLSRPNPGKGLLSFGLGVSNGLFVGTGNIESFEGRSSGGGAGVLAAVGFSKNSTTDDVVIFGGAGASVNPLLAQVGASESNTGVLSAKDLFPGLFDSGQASGPQLLFIDQITVRDKALEIIDLTEECPHLDGPCIERIPTEPLSGVRNIE
jgi:RHS repeat-associated protein